MTSVFILFTYGVCDASPLTPGTSLQWAHSYLISLTWSKSGKINTNRQIFPACSGTGLIYPQRRSTRVIEWLGCDIIAIWVVFRWILPADCQVPLCAQHRQTSRGPHRWDTKRKMLQHLVNNLVLLMSPTMLTSLCSQRNLSTALYPMLGDGVNFNRIFPVGLQPSNDDSMWLRPASLRWPGYVHHSNYPLFSWRHVHIAYHKCPSSHIMCFRQHPVNSYLSNCDAAKSDIMWRKGSWEKRNRNILINAIISTRCCHLFVLFALLISQQTH